MKTKIIDSRKIAQEIKSDLAKKVLKLDHKPSLAVIMIGDDKASYLYIKQKEKAAIETGITLCKYFFKQDNDKKEVFDTIEWLNKDGQINGMIVQLPLPQAWPTEKIIKAINPKKDVDGLLNKEFVPPFISAIISALESIEQNLNKKKILALVNSDVFGKKMCQHLKEKGWNASYVIARTPIFSRRTKQSRIIPRDCHALTSSKLAMTKSADILITALGQPNFIKADMIKKDSILIDAGISFKDGKVTGDIDAASVSKKAAYLCPVPGGIGPITVAMLLKNVIIASQNN